MKKILLTLILFVLIAGCAKQEVTKEGPISEPQVEETRPEVTGEKPAEEPEEVIPQPPTGAVSVYKGFWMPCMFMDDKCQPMSDAKLLKEAGANIAAFAPTLMINPQGEVSFLREQMPMEEQLKWGDKRVGELAEKYYKEGIRIHLVIDSLYVNDFSETTPAGGAPSFPKSSAEKPGFLDEYNKVVEEVAKIAEKYHVEIFSPMNEPDMKLGEKAASKWGQEVLPLIKKHYHGKVLWKAALIQGAGPNINFKGYDAIGMDPSPGGGPYGGIEAYDEDIEKMLNDALSWAKRDNVPYVMFTEFGVWGGALSFTEEQKAIAHRIVFEKGQGKVKGFIALDPPADLDRAITGTKTLEEIKTWFKEKLK